MYDLRNTEDVVMYVDIRRDTWSAVVADGPGMQNLAFGRFICPLMVRETYYDNISELLVKIADVVKPWNQVRSIGVVGKHFDFNFGRLLNGAFPSDRKVNIVPVHLNRSDIHRILLDAGFFSPNPIRDSAVVVKEDLFDRGSMYSAVDLGLVREGPDSFFLTDKGRLYWRLTSDSV